MNVLPVITRELRMQARQPLTFRLRLFGVLALLAACAWFLAERHSERNVGGLLFGTLHLALFYTTLLLVTFSAADCLSRERREGTLGLLLLTPLRAPDIIIAKSLAHAMRAFTLVLAVIPIFALPMLLGGVSGQQLMMSLLLIFSAICVALGAAILASAWCKQWLRALVMALLFVVAGWLALTLSLGTLLFTAFARSNSNFYYGSSLDYTWLAGIAFVSGRMIEIPNSIGGAFLRDATIAIAQTAVLSFVWLLGAIWFAARRMRKVWREEPPSAGRQWMEQKLTTPVVGLNFYKRWMRSLLNRNPVGWLQRRAWQGRLVTWVWLAIVISVTSNALNYRNLIRNFSEMQHALAWLLVISLAATVAGSFRRERETGVLELLLVSPLGAGRIIRGRLLGLWGQFLPAVAIFIFTWAYIVSLIRQSEDYPAMFFFLFLFATLPVIGLYFSLRSQSFIGAFLLALAFGVALPMFSERVVPFLHDLDTPSYYSYSAIIHESLWDRIAVWLVWLIPYMIQLGLAVFLLYRTRQRLEQRQFNFERTTV